jgi:hypothetical protein
MPGSNAYRCENSGAAAARAAASSSVKPQLVALPAHQL